MIPNSLTQVWEDYERGMREKHRLGLFETARRNERFYRGDQWQSADDSLPHPVFNLVRRVTDYLVTTVMPGDVSIRFCDQALPFAQSEATRKALQKSLSLLEKNAALRWRNQRMEEVCTRALLDAALTGDGVFYCRWDPDARDGQAYHGDVRTEPIDAVNLFVADYSHSDLQAQEWVMLSGRQSVSSLRREALDAGADDAILAKILPDSAYETSRGAPTADPDSDHATTLVRFHREGGEVICEKFTRGARIKCVQTGLSRYPIAYFHWYGRKHSAFGNAPVSDMIANQRYVNSAYALAMKHMGDTAFSKVVYDKSRIPEWSNAVGEAIGVLGGGNVSDAVSVLGVGKMQDGYLDLITHTIENTKSMMGATESALGDERANNTSAILALQEASKVTLKQVRARLCRCIAELAEIWADMLCSYCPAERMLAYWDDKGEPTADTPDYALLRRAILTATAEVGEINRYTPSATVAVLDKLLDAGHIGVETYLKLLPEGTLANRETVLQTLQKERRVENE